MRHWKAVTTSFATLCARLSATASMALCNGLGARRMTPEEFGLWSILFTLSFFATGMDLGFRFTLGNRLAALAAKGEGGEEERRRTFLSILFLQIALAAGYILLLTVVSPFIPWAHWFKISNPILARQTVWLMPGLLILMVAPLPVALMWTVFYAYQEIKLASFLAGLATVVQTAFFVVAAYRCPFAMVMVLYFAANLSTSVALTVYVFIRRGWKFSLVPLDCILATVRSLSRVSFHAFLLTFFAIISANLAPIVSAAISGLAVAGDFYLIFKLFNFLTTAHLALLAPVSPSVTRDSYAGSWDAVRRRLRVCLFQIWPGFFFPLGLVIWWFHPLLIRLWGGPAHSFHNYPLAGLLLLMACLVGLSNTFSVFLNSLGLVKIQAVLACTMLIPILVLPPLLGKWFGLPGLASAFIICNLPSVIVLPIYLRRALRLRLLRV